MLSKLEHHFLMLPVQKPCYIYTLQGILFKLEHYFLMLPVQKPCYMCAPLGFLSKLKHHFLMLPVPKPCYFYAPQEILSKLEHHFLMLSVQKHCKYTLPQETELQVLAGLRPVKNNWTLDQTAIMHGKASLDGPNQPCMLAGSSDVLISCSYGKRHTVNS